MGRPFDATGARRPGVESRSVSLRAVLVASALTLVAAGPAAAHVREAPDDILKSIGVDEKLGARVPLDLRFRDQDGKTVTLRDCFTGGPAILTLNYYTCPMLCPLTLRSLLSAAAAVRGLSLDRDYRIVTVSIDAAERPEAARARAGEMHALMKEVGDPASRWPFLAGDEKSVGALTAAVGFRYRKVGAEFAHPDVAIVLTPDGRVSRYLYGIAPDPKDLRLALVEAAGGRIGASRAWNQVLLYCFHYDPVGKKYALYAINIMKAGGAVTLVLLGTVYFLLLRRRRPASSPAGKGTR